MAKDFNLGNDCSVVVQGPFGEIDFGIVTNFRIKQRVKKTAVEPLNGAPLEKHVPMGWEGSFEIARATSAADDFANAIEAGFLATGELGDGLLTQYVTEKNKSTSIYLGDGLAMNLTDAGSWERGKEVRQSIEFFISTRKKIG